MTSNYNKFKSKEETLAQTTKAKKQPNVTRSEGAVIGNTAGVSGVSGKGYAGQNTKGNVRANGAVVKRHSKQIKPEEVRAKLPGFLEFLGFDAKQKFETIAISTANRHPIVIKIAIAVLIPAMFATLVVNAVGITKLKTETTQMNSQLASLIEREAELSLELEKRDDLRYIREVALNQYGMIDKKHVTKYYISLEKEPKVELAGNDESEPIIDKEAD